MQNNSVDTLGIRGKPGSFFRKSLQILAIGTSLYHLYIAFFGVPISIRHRPIHLLLVFVILFLSYPSKGKDKFLSKIPFSDWILVIFTALSTGYLIFSADRLMIRMPFVTSLTLWEYILGITLILLILMAVYRVIGLSLTVLGSLFLLYGYFGKFLPGPLWHKGYSLGRIVEILYLTLDGVWSIPIHVTSTFVFLFILFGCFLRVSGASDFFTDISHTLTHKSAGGPAKCAIVASSLMGTVSGSSTANVVTTGAFTIPAMKKAGYSPSFAGAVESVSSTGGQIVPPIMGAAAFIMAEFTGIPYIRIMIYALVPALLYYLGVYVMVHIEALKKGLKAFVGEKPPALKSILLSRGYLFIPVITIIYFLVQGYTPLRAAFYAIFILLFLVFLFSKNKKGFPKMVLRGLEEAPKVVVPVTAACACAGIVVGIISLTGLGQRVTSIILVASQGILPAALFLTMILAIVLGMGMPTSSAYIIMAALLAPALIKMGVPLIAAHMYIFYFACLSAITPPVALASYAAASLAGASPAKTAYTALRLGLAAYIVPYMFVYHPSLLLIGDFYIVIVTIISAICGILALGTAVQGWLYGKISIIFRILLFTSALLLIWPELFTSIFGAVMLITLSVFRYKLSKK